jgi:hypothetical protein
VDLLLAASETDETFCEEDVVHELGTFMLAVRIFALVLASAVVIISRVMLLP